MKEKNIVGKRIRFLRIQHGYTQQEIINILGVGKSAYSMYENGERTMLNSKKSNSFSYNIFFFHFFPPIFYF